MSTSTKTAAGASGGLLRAVRGSLQDRAFLLCAATLIVMTMCFYGATRGVRFRKLEAPIRRPLARLDKGALLPYRFVSAQELQSDMLDSLGTKEYLQWVLADESEGERLPNTELVGVFVAYYTGNPDPVPHVPDICMRGNGYEPVAAEDQVMHVPTLGADADVSVRVLEFKKPGRVSDRVTVVYTFRTNDRWASDRNTVRNIVGDPREEYAYFSKVEVRFQGRSGASPTRADAVKATERFLAKLLPVLVDDHWPDWEALHKKAEPPSDAGTASASVQ